MDPSERPLQQGTEIAAGCIVIRNILIVSDGWSLEQHMRLLKGEADFDVKLTDGNALALPEWFDLDKFQKCVELNFLHVFKFFPFQGPGIFQKKLLRVLRVEIMRTNCDSSYSGNQPDFSNDRAIVRTKNCI